MNAAPCELCGRVNLVEAPRPREKMHLPARMMRALLMPLGWRVHALTAVFCGFAVWAMTVHWITPFLGITDLGLLLSGLTLAAVWLIRLALRGGIWLLAPATRQYKRPGARSFLILPGCLSLLWMLNRFDVPLRMGFWISRGGLEQQVGFALFGPRPIALGVGDAGIYCVHFARRDWTKCAFRGQ